MLRKTLAVVAGYAVIMGIVIAASGAVMLLMPSYRVSTESGAVPSTPSVVIMFLFGAVAAVAGGWICQRLARGAYGPALILAGLVLVLGLAMAPAGVMRGQPAWFAWLTPLLGMSGVLVGGFGLARRAPCQHADHHRAPVRPS